MKKNLLYREIADQIVARSKRLQPGTKAKWGKMTATEMLLHCNLCNSQVFEESFSARKTTIKQYLLRILALYIAPNFKKNVKGDERNDTKGKIETTEFEAQRAQFIQLINRFADHQQPITLHHPAFGNISTKQWGIAAYKHIDHHLRQFGV